MTMRMKMRRSGCLEGMPARTEQACQNCFSPSAAYPAPAPPSHMAAASLQVHCIAHISTHA